MRRLVREVRHDPASLVLPVFVDERLTAPVAIDSLPGVERHTLTSLADAVRAAANAGIGGVMIFAVPGERDPDGSAAFGPESIMQRAIRSATDAAEGRVVVMSDVCLDEFTSHGHCGVLDEHGRVDNDQSLAAYARMAVDQAAAGADVVGLSGMMDGQVAAVRVALDRAGHTDTAILAYAAKFASAFYGPFREAVDSRLEGDRHTYQLDPRNGRAGLRESVLDAAEGADIVMVKPGLPYLDVLAEVAAASLVPVASYHVSGEFAQIEAAADRGWLDRKAAHLEALTAMRRAGADIVFSYAALDLAAWIAEPPLPAGRA
jgi:porphobilinogen synthase